MDVKVEGLAAAQAKRSPISLSHRDYIKLFLKENKTKQSAFLKPSIKFVPELKRKTCQGRVTKEEDILFHYLFFSINDFMA